MDDKEVRIDSGLGTSIRNDSNKRLPSGNVTYTNKDKLYPDSSHPLGKADTRPCAIIGPDRVLPSTDTNDVYMKTIPVEPWEYPDNYRHPYDSLKMSEYHQTNNISPRQTFQENMQRIMVPPTYSSIKSSDETSLKNPKLNIPTEGKYCDVPYSMNTLSSEPKSVQSDSVIPTLNPSFPRAVPPHGWSGGGMQPLKPYQAHGYYHNSEYSNCPATRPMPIVQPQRIVHDEIHPMYTDRLYQESNIRFKPYPTSKEKFPQPRYEYANTFQPPQNHIPKFDIQKSMHGHHYPMYPQGPYKYTVDRRYPEPMMENHQRALYPQNNAFRTHPIHPSYGPIPGNFYQNKSYPCHTENQKSLHINKLSYDANNKIYLELENPRYKGYPSPDNFYYNDRAKLMRGDILLPGHTQINNMGQQHFYKKDNLSIKNFDHSPHYPYRDHRNLGNPLARMPLQFSPNTVTMSPCDPNTSNESLMLGIPQEDCGYVSQSSTTSIRSMDCNNSPGGIYKRQGLNYTSTNQNSSRRESNSKTASLTDNKKGLNLSQFFQMWNEGDEEESTNNNEVKVNSNYVSPKPQINNNQEQLYILGSVTVSQDELSKYEHLQKVSKLPENIKGFNNIEILNQFEQLVESPGISNLHVKNSSLKEYKVIPQTFSANKIQDGIQRPVSPLDVEAKISQSVIHKEVGCNFEIKPCSPKVLNVDVAAPVHDVLGERFIEKVANPVLLSLGKDAESKIEVVDKSMKVTSCKLANGKFNQNIVNSAIVKPLYPLQDLNPNVGVCLASLPQLDSDIDLNLPEVNQQFIDANKIESSCSPHGKISLLENTQPNNTFNKIHSEGPVTYPEADKETTKLSKYRKTKKPDALVNSSTLSSMTVSSAQRTNSVIIKNPENIKVYNENQNESLEVVEKTVDIIQESDNTETYNDVACYQNMEKAIDFSVNRNEKTINTKNEVEKTTPIITDDLHKKESNKHLALRDCKNKMSDNTTDTKSIAKYFDLVNVNLINNNSSTFLNSDKEQFTAYEEKHCNLAKNKQIQLEDTELCDFPSNIGTSTGQEIKEPEKEQGMNVELKNKEISKKENYIFSNSPLINSANNLPDLSFELTDVPNEQLTHSHVNDISNQRINYSKLETAITGLTTEANIEENAINGQITNLYATSKCNKQICIENNASKITVDTNNPVDTIERELEDMDTKCDIPSKDLSNVNPLKTVTANTNCISQENVNEPPSSSSASIIKSSDSSSNIKDEKYSTIQDSNKTEKCKSPADFTVEENLLLENDHKTLFSGILTNYEEDKVNLKSPSKENNFKCEKELLYESLHNSKNKDDKTKVVDELVCLSVIKGEVDSKVETDTCDKITSDDSEKPLLSCDDSDYNQISEDTIAIYTHHEDCQSLLKPINEADCDEIMQVFKIENSCNHIEQAEEISDNHQGSVCKTQYESKNSYIVEKFDSANYKQRIHRKALYSPWIQNLILYNTEDQNSCNNKNYTEVNKINHDEHLIENVDDIKDEVISNHKLELNGTLENIEKHENYCKSRYETVEVLQTINEFKDDINKNLDNSKENIKLCPIFQNSNEVDVIIEKSDTSSLVSSDFDQTHLARFISPVTSNYINNVKLLRRTSKRSFSDSSLRSVFEKDESISAKKCKMNEEGTLSNQSPSIETNLSNIFRRNSISEIYNDGNVVILIDEDLILAEEKEETKISINEEESTNKYDSDSEIINTIAENFPQYEKELWVEDIACTETVFSDEVAEDVEIGITTSPKDFISCNYETVNNESFMLCEEVIKNMENDVDVDGSNTCHGSTYSIHSPYNYHASNEDDIFTCLESPKESVIFTDDKMESNRRKAENILNHFETSTTLFPKVVPTNDDKENVEVLNRLIQETETGNLHNIKSHNQENSDCDNYGNYSCTLSTCNYSSSPEVTSTTCEDKNPGIILKISNHKRSKSCQLDGNKPTDNSNISYKLTEKKKYKSNFNSSGTLITKAAQKYIPPIKITISDLKVKLPLPKNSLDKLKQLKKSKDEPKKDKIPTKTYSLSTPREMKKPKPKFEDVLMSIDKFQYSKPKVKNKKMRDEIPKVVIKKTESGSHYTSSSSSSGESTQNPDLTGRKWQPWVFIEKNNFVDKMALKHKVKAIYCRRKESYVLAERFRKYKSVYNAKFVISQPNSDDLNKGNLKYTIRLKHH